MPTFTCIEIHGFAIPNKFNPLPVGYRRPIEVEASTTGEAAIEYAKLLFKDSPEYAPATYCIRIDQAKKPPVFMSVSIEPAIKATTKRIVVS